MGLKTAVKKAIMRRVMKKRKANAVLFDEKASEFYEHKEDADTDANNSYYFTAHDKLGNSLIFRLGKRIYQREVWFAFVTKEGEAFVNVERLFEDENFEVNCTASIECIEPLKNWKFNFKGIVVPVIANKNLIAVTNGEPIEAEFNGEFTALDGAGFYEFSRDTDSKAFIRAVVSEKWGKDFSKNLNKNHQHHTEQSGHIFGEFFIDKQKKGEIKCNGLRDHSFGRRVWSYMNRHAWVVEITTDGSVYNSNMVRYPALNVMGLKTGFKMDADKTHVNVVNSSFEEGVFYSGEIPKNSTYKVNYSDGTTVAISYNLNIAFPFEFIDSEGGYTIYEGISDYIVEANGRKIKAKGITEVGYNKDRERYCNPIVGDA